MKLQPAFGKVLSRRRSAKPGLTQSELAKQLDCHRVTVSEWERGAHLPHDRTIAEILTILGATPQDFFEEVAARLADELDRRHPVAHIAEPKPAADELSEASVEAYRLPAARSVRPQLEALHRAIDDLVVGLVTSYFSRRP